MIVAANITRENIDLGKHNTAVRSSRCGALAIFVGQVRDHDPDAEGEVVALEYSAHPDAETVLAALLDRVVESVADQSDRTGGTDEIRVAATHRIGNLEVGDDALVVTVAAAHRAEAFAVCREVVEAIKAELPIWKRQWEHDGGSSWVGL